MLDSQTVLKALSRIKAPGKDTNIVAMNMVSGLHIDNEGNILFMIDVDPEQGAALEPLRQQAEACVASLKGAGKVTAILTAERKPAHTHTARTSKGNNDPHGMNKNPKLTPPIRKIIAVASGKGGVGKSTISIAIAKSLAENSQLKIGILDADIYGPSIPTMAGLTGQKPAFTPENKIIPLNVQAGKHGLKIMSIGFMVETEKALIWRGPMIQSALYQLFRDVLWGTQDDPLDILIVDMPPGTGDAQLTLAQKVPVSGAVIVSTPQDIALLDVRKGIEMFNQTNVPILGIIENMSTHICSNCGHEDPVFGHGGARLEAEKLGVSFLGEIPLSRHIREKSDAGLDFTLDPEITARILNALG
ncbi:MAG: Mrp/NBP35 family ATP-binding protein [Alphaproteobacteria bacterium]|nr:Mrp/NBP35 family ATP-binding protein [Alphaproteobacteria bacterium]